MPISRRNLARGAAALSAAPLIATAAPARAADDPFAPLLARWSDLMTGGSAVDPDDPDYAAALAALDAQADPLWDSLDRSPGRTALWPGQDLPGPDAVNANASLNNLRTLATAWATAGTRLSGNADAPGVLAEALGFVTAQGYAPTRKETGNWWNWEIGCPRALADTCVLLRAHLTADALAAHLAAIAHFAPNPDRRTNSPSLPETGANRTDKCVITALRGILAGDAATVALARDGVSDVRDSGKNSIFAYVTSGDGFYADGSFVQHEHLAYIGSYGSVLYDGTSRLLQLLAGTDWAVTDPKQSILLDGVEKSVAPFLTNGLMMDAVRGRAIARQASTDHDTAAAIIAALLVLAGGAPAADAARIRALCKGWIRRDTARNYLARAAVPAIAAAKAVLADASVPAAPEPTYHRVFADQDRFVHRRPNWSFTATLASKRMGRFEAGNDENQTPWYQGDGMTYLYLGDDQAHYTDGYWPTVDPYLMPGTTAGTEPREKVTGAGTGILLAFNSWSGGAFTDTRGAAGLDLISYDKTLTARKSWFSLDDAVVALGAAITRTGAGTAPVRTVIENRRTPDGTAFEVHDGWAHLAGAGGYVLLEPDALHASAGNRTGTWRAIDSGADTGGDTTPVTRHYTTLLLEHGANPSDAHYAYALLPGASAGAAAGWAAKPPVRVLANTGDVQGISTGRLTLANFFAAGEAGRLAADGPASVVVEQTGSRATVAVADPSRTAGTVTVTLPFPATAVDTADPGLTLAGDRPRAVLKADLGGTRGHTLRAVLRI